MRVFNTAIAISVGLLVLIGYFVPGLSFLSDMLLHWAVILAGFALLLGMINLFSVHARRLVQREKNAFYSGVLIVSFLLALVVIGVATPTGDAAMWIFQNIQLPIETSLMAILVVTLSLSAMRLMRRRMGVLPILFILTVILVLLGTAPLYGYGTIPALSYLKQWIAQVPAMAGGRGLLIGVALGAIATGLRILIGADRPYGS